MSTAPAKHWQYSPVDADFEPLDEKSSWGALTWLKPDAIHTEWGTRATPSKKGLTLKDINIGPYGEVPEKADPRHCMAPRGADIQGEMPDLGHTLDEKWMVWADNVCELYEEAVARQWSATRDIPWDTLEPLPDEIERAVCVMCTLLTEVEMIASDFPSLWVNKISQDYHEVKMFLCTQAMDEARHLEVFRKRALANGGGLTRCLPGNEWALKNILDSETYTIGSTIMHLFAEGVVLDIFRAGEALAQNPAEKAIYRRCMQDEARHVAYGVGHLKYVMKHHPQAADVIHKGLDTAEEIQLETFKEPDFNEAQAVLLVGGADRAKLREGLERMRAGWKLTRESYLRRCDVGGLDRRSRTKLPEAAPF